MATLHTQASSTASQLARTLSQLSFEAQQLRQQLPAEAPGFELALEKRTLQLLRRYQQLQHQARLRQLNQTLHSLEHDTLHSDTLVAAEAESQLANVLHLQYQLHEQLCQPASLESHPE
jgi:DNA-binding transcriptional regulator YbjK